jgi:hypothetical protein
MDDHRRHTDVVSFAFSGVWLPVGASNATRTTSEQRSERVGIFQRLFRRSTGSTADRSTSAH